MVKGKQKNIEKKGGRVTDSRTDCIPSPQTLFKKEIARGEGEKEEERNAKNLTH